MVIVGTSDGLMHAGETELGDTRWLTICSAQGAEVLAGEGTAVNCPRCLGLPTAHRTRMIRRKRYNGNLICRPLQGAALERDMKIVLRQVRRTLDECVGPLEENNIPSVVDRMGLAWRQLGEILSKAGVDLKPPVLDLEDYDD